MTSDVTGTRAGEIVRPWGDGERTFRLTIGGWRKVQEKCDAGPGEIAARLGGLGAFLQRYPNATPAEVVVMGGLGAWRIDDQREVLMQGLIGGGLSPTEAATLVRENFDERPLFENVSLALAVVMASILGPEDEPLGKSRGETDRAGTLSPEEN